MYKHKETDLLLSHQWVMNKVSNGTLKMCETNENGSNMPNLGSARFHFHISKRKFVAIYAISQKNYLIIYIPKKPEKRATI